MKTPLRKLATLCGVSDREAAYLILISACGWVYFAYSYLYETGLGVAVTRYAGY